MGCQRKVPPPVCCKRFQMSANAFISQVVEVDCGNYRNYNGWRQALRYELARLRRDSNLIGRIASNCSDSGVYLIAERVGNPPASTAD